ncbi:hypothetical protein [Blastopirellula marina]|uniref:Uncharacterized protein n=1 Tax=Blastopirellula marina TaxID=124 RepID=A0A2S8G270_9BACT|nr:hypothetical protein [Blastopirellula marina]PQO38234.1 hypothetical protein C5Y98_09195 [Blastopirellula marina]PTL44890.1 hypothetical protein C5Y97_09200 [Blastopirellula marina]
MIPLIYLGLFVVAPLAMGGALVVVAFSHRRRADGTRYGDPVLLGKAKSSRDWSDADESDMSDFVDVDIDVD